jgi:predicted MFS family arabinose efflux permease
MDRTTQHQKARSSAELFSCWRLLFPFRAIMFGLAGSAVHALMPLVARDLVGGGPVTFGLLLGAFGMGAITGGLFSSRIRQSRGTEGLVRLSFTGFAACALVSAFSSIPH